MFLVGYLIGVFIFAIIYGGAKLILDNIELNQRFKEYERREDEMMKRFVEERKEIHEKLSKTT
jgi:hypothetical protein